MAPIVHGLRLKWGDQVNFVYVDILDQDSKPLKKALDYRGIPQFVLLNGEGTILQQWLGEVQEWELDAAIQETIP